MNKTLATGLAMLITTATGFGQSQPRPPAVPLIACDPYFSVWSFTDTLNGGPTHHWTGKPQRLTGLVRIDGQAFRLMGINPPAVPAARQTNLTVLPTRSVYTFEEAGVQITLTFMTPLLPDDLMIMSRPVTYVTWSARSTTDATHDVSVYFDADAELAVNVPAQAVSEKRGTAGALTTLRVGTIEQPVLESRGDDQRIDWGYFYLASPAKTATLAPAMAARDAFLKDGSLPASEPTANAPAATAAVLATTLSLGKVGTTAASGHVILAYDDSPGSIRYFNSDLKAYWQKDGATIGDLLQTSEKEYASLEKRSAAFDQEMVADLKKLGGDAYVQLGVLAYRQSLAAQKICADANGQPLSFSKENFSNGCCATVDVLYPASPLMMTFSPNLLKASLEPLLDYSSSPRWKHDSAPHDLGTYPQATGQVYGGGDSDSGMPVEESGNMLGMVAALSKIEGNAAFAERYWPTLTKWATYLKNNGFDPGNQLTTDDFAGHIARNTNLSAKAIMGVAGYAMMADMLKKDDAAQWMDVAKQAARDWMQKADQGDHYGLVFGDKGQDTWSQKYNIVWDTILGLNVFPPEVREKEMAYYMTKMNKYGLPLDSRKTYTKLDWEVWTATLADKHEDFQTIVDAAAKWTNETPDRVPLSDWYETISGKKSGFQARSVVGGVFLPFLKDAAMWQKWAGRDKTKLGSWAQTDFTAPAMTTIVPAADTEAAEWKYTLTKPADAIWFAPTFDDSNWKTGKSGFGTEGTPAARVGTKWSTDDIWIRREITLPDGKLDEPRLWMHHDEDAQVYLNGVLAAKPGGFTAEYVSARISKAARDTLKPGKNTIAIHCHQTVAGQYIDAGIVDLVPQKKN